MRSAAVALVCLAALTAAVIVPPARAQVQTGWYLMSDGEDGDVRYVREVLISAGKVKELPRHPTATWVVYDTSRGEIAMVNPAREVYARGTPAELCRSLADSSNELQAALRRLPPDAPGAGPAPSSATTAAPEVSFRERTPRTRLQDFEEVLYEIRADGRWFQRAWLSDDERLMGALGNPEGLAAYVDMRHQFATCSRETLGAATGAAAVTMRALVESSPAYLEVMRKGWPLNIAWNADGRQVTETVTIAAEWSVSPSTLEPPGNYRELSLAEILGVGGR